MPYFYSEIIWEYFRQEFEQGDFSGKDNCRLHYVRSRDTSASSALIVLGGRTEFCQKYAELFYDLRDTGFCFYSYDHRGQGLSQRLLADHGKGHVVRFSDYAEDLRIFLNEMVIPNGHDKVIVLSHSMGGTIAMDFQLRYPGTLDGCILSSPMFGIVTAPLPGVFAEMLVGTAVFSGFGERFIIGNGNYESSGQFANNKLTSSEARFQTTQNLFEHFTLAKLGGPTFNWLHESFAAMRKVVSRAERISIPLLLLQSGDDQVVDAGAQNRFAAACGSCSIITIERARHELLMEDDRYRGQGLSGIRRFLNGRARSRQG